jgi:hypothetical protein
MDRSRQLTDGTRWRTFMRLLRVDDLVAFYTNARPEADLLVVDLDLGTASGPERQAPSRESRPPPILALLNHRKIPNIYSNEGNNDEEQDAAWIAAGD